MKIAESAATYELQLGSTETAVRYKGSQDYILGILDFATAANKLQGNTPVPIELFEVRTTKITERTLRNRAR